MLKAQLLGNIGRDAESRTTPEQVTFVTFSVAQQQRKTNPPKPAVWVDCIWRGERAAKVAQYLQRGTKVLVAGDISLRSWKGRDGSEKMGLQISVDHIEFAGGAAGETQGQAGQRQAGAEPPPVRDLPGQQGLPGVPQPRNDFADDDSVPF